MNQLEAEKWSKHEVHHWLMTQVKVPQNCADKFIEEDVLGEYLVSFSKTDILDLGIKHGPAVKITCYLQSLSAGSQHQSQLPAYVETWTKQQVSQWLLQHVNIYSKYAQLLLQEDVSGDCLVCFRKQDFLDLGVKSGPAVKILAELANLKKTKEPTLQPTPQTSTDQNDGEQSAHPDPSLPPSSANKPPDPQDKCSPQKVQLKIKNTTEEETTGPRVLRATPDTAVVKYQCYTRLHTE